MTNPWLSWWTDNASLAQQATFPRILIAMLLGCVIGAERQWRQRAAGLRTNALVCFGAAAFVDLGSTVGGPTTTNVFAYVISGGRTVYRVTITFRREHKQAVSALLVHSVTQHPLMIRQLRTEENEGSDEAVIDGVVESATGDKLQSPRW
jgi:MgtC family